MTHVHLLPVAVVPITRSSAFMFHPIESDFSNATTVSPSPYIDRVESHVHTGIELQKIRLTFMLHSSLQL